MIKKITNYYRKDLFNRYNSFDNPYVSLTIPIEVTNIVKYCKKNRHFYATMGFLITKTINEVEEFKYRFRNNKFYYCDVVNSSFTQIKDEDSIGFFTVPFTIDYKEYINNYVKIEDKFLNSKYVLKESIDEVWLSCAPWFSITSITTPYTKKISVPSFVWDKFEQKGNKYYLNLMISFHHGFIDGVHVKKFVDSLNDNIKRFK